MGPRRERRGNNSNYVTFKDCTWASMGPRRERRGNDVLDFAEEYPFVLQWGRVVKDAEIHSTHRSESVRCSASMGPRRERRGNAEKCNRFHLQLPSFNGAAS